MSIHVAILKRQFLHLVLSGAKTVESRLTRTTVPPYRVIETGDRLYLKESGGPFRATAVAGGVEFFENLTPADVDALRRRHQASVGGDDDYWRAKRDSRFATFIALRDVTPCDSGPAFPASAYRAWFVLPDEANPVLEVTLTAGAIRNRYVTILGRRDFFPTGDFTVLLPGGRRVVTSLYRGQRIRWRGWGPVFARHGVEAGDRVTFSTVGRASYRISFRRRPR